MTDAVMTVTELTANIKKNLEQAFTSVVVMGEVSRLTKPASGHMYFTIKDNHAALTAVVWRSALQRMVLQPTEHQAFVFSGYISLYEPRGAYQLVVTRIEAMGAGQLAAAFEKRKALFASRGWFDQKAKQDIPSLPQHIGIVTSASTAAFEDVKKVLNMRPAWLRLTLAPAVVQGDMAAASIAKALWQLNQLANRPDVILLVRGGGSIEDLWCFNDEQVVRAIVESDIPVITGIGHEIDVSLADFAADMRAATPSNAAEICCPTRQALRNHLPKQKALQHGLWQRLMYLRRQHKQAREQLFFATRRMLDAYHYHVSQSQRVTQHHSMGLLAHRRRNYKAFWERLLPHEPRACLQHQRAQCTALIQRLHVLMATVLQHNQSRHQQVFSLLSSGSSMRMQRLISYKQLLDSQLHALGPQQVLSRGYALAYRTSGQLVTGVNGLTEGEEFSLQLHDGRVSAHVLRLHKKILNKS